MSIIQSVKCDKEVSVTNLSGEVCRSWQELKKQGFKKSALDLIERRTCRSQCVSGVEMSQMSKLF